MDVPAQVVAEPGAVATVALVVRAVDLAEATGVVVPAQDTAELKAAATVVSQVKA